MKQKAGGTEMNGAENYMEHMRHSAVRRILPAFMGYVLTGSVFSVLSRLLFLRWHTDLLWRITPCPGSGFVSALLSQSPTVFLLLLRYPAVFTVFSRQFSRLCAILYGSGIGCAAAFLSRGILTGISPARLYVSFGLMLAILLLCAVSDLYSDCFLTLSGIRENRIRNSLFCEFTVLYGVFSGAILLAGIPAALFLP